MTDLTALLERVRAATGPDIALSGQILCALNGTRLLSAEFFYTGHIKVAAEKDGERWESTFADPLVSIDAALALVERTLPGLEISLTRYGGAWDAEFARLDEPDMDGTSGPEPSPTPALALLRALLSALIEKDKTP